MASVRCHAAILNGVMTRDVVVSYTGSTTPDDNGMTINCEDIKISDFTSECHSTIAFNGVAVIEGQKLSFIPISLYKY